MLSLKSLEWGIISISSCTWQVLLSQTSLGAGEEAPLNFFSNESANK